MIVNVTKQKKRRVRSAGERKHNDNEKVEGNYKNYNDKAYSVDDNEEFGLNKGKDVDLLPKRRKKESMRAYLLRATRVFEKVEKNVGRRSQNEPVLAFVERARKALLNEGVVGVVNKNNAHPEERPPRLSESEEYDLNTDATMLM